MKVLSICVAGLVAGAACAEDVNRGVMAAEDALTAGRVIIPGDGRVSVSLDRKNATYRCGEAATFSVAGAERISWTLDNYGARVLDRGDADLVKDRPLKVKGTMDRPGFLRLTVRGTDGKILRRYSAAFEPQRIRTAVPKPKDFDSFWDEAMARLEREVPLDPRVERVPEFSTDAVDVYRVSFATFGGRVYGSLTVPRGAKGRRHPVRVVVPGAGPGFIMPRGKRLNGSAIELVMSVHGFPVPDSEEERTRLYEAQEKACRQVHGPSNARAYPVKGLTQTREDVHFHPVILGINRAVDWLAKRPDVDLGRFTYRGASQGGGFGLYLCALNRHFTRAYMGVPALTDLLGCKADGRQSGWPRILEYETQEDPARLAKIEENAPYFDAAYFAERITIPVRLSVGYVDESCAPHAVCAAYNAIPAADKRLYHGIGGHHGSPNAPSNEIDAFLDKAP